MQLCDIRSILLLGICNLSLIKVFEFSIINTSATNDDFINFKEIHEFSHTQNHVSKKTVLDIKNYINAPTVETYRTITKKDLAIRTKLEDVFISIKSTVKYHGTRMKVLLDT